MPRAHDHFWGYGLHDGSIDMDINTINAQLTADVDCYTMVMECVHRLYGISERRSFEEGIIGFRLYGISERGVHCRGQNWAIWH